MALSLPYISVPEWLPSLPYISMPEWLPSLPYISVPEWLPSLPYISVPEWLPSLPYSVPERMAFTSVPEWLAYQNGSITGRTLASQNGIFTAITAVACQNGCILYVACYLKCAHLAARTIFWRRAAWHGSHSGTLQLSLHSLTGLSWSVPRVCTNVVVAWCAFTLFSR